MDRQYVAIDLHLKRSLMVRENKAGEELGVTQIDNDRGAVVEVIEPAWLLPQPTMRPCGAKR